MSLSNTDAAVLLSVVSAAAIAVALTAPGEHRLAGLLVLTDLVARWALRHRPRRPDLPDSPHGVLAHCRS